MRSIWTGSISFGLVNIPVKLYNGTRNISLDLDMLHEKDLSPIRYARVCKEEGEEVAYEEIVKGYEYEKGRYVVVSDKDFERADVKKSKSIEISAFIDIDEIDPNYFERPYLVEPDKGADKSYALLREALKETRRVGLAQFVMRNREHLCMVRPQERFLVLNQLRFSAELQSPEQLEVPAKSELSSKEMALAKSLIDQLTAEFDPEAYHDTYHEELKQLIEAKLAGKAPAKISKVSEPSNVRDLMSLLKASLDKEPQTRSEKTAARKTKVSHTTRSGKHRAS